MAEEGFLRRWSRLKATGGEAVETPVRPAPPAPAPAPPPAALRHHDSAAGAPPPTLEDVARLTPESDFSAFVAQGVDKSVQRLALKKLFSDPHFHVMDGLDMYMDDYNKPSPMSAAMLAALEHAKSALRPSEPHRPQAAADADAPGMATQAAAGQAPGSLDAQAAPDTAPDANGTLADTDTDAAREDAAQPAGEDACDGTCAPSACTLAGTLPQSQQGQA